MTKTIHFTKMHGAGNDYIYIDNSRHPMTTPEKTAIQWSTYHTGIGSDGLVLIETSDKADFGMRIFNADGSEALMCGNASRCIGKYVYEHGLTNKTQITLDTLSGIKTLTLHIKNKIVDAVTVDMGEPQQINEIRFGAEFPFVSTSVAIGNLHLVTFVADINRIDLDDLGPKLENHPYFPNKTNVEFAQIPDNGKIRMRVWERGSGITQACGTGACATAIAAFARGLSGRKSDVIMDGGTLTIKWDESTNHILMTGPATKVFDGTIEMEI